MLTLLRLPPLVGLRCAPADKEDGLSIQVKAKLEWHDLILNVMPEHQRLGCHFWNRRKNFADVVSKAECDGKSVTEYTCVEIYFRQRQDIRNDLLDL